MGRLDRRPGVPRKIAILVGIVGLSVTAALAVSVLAPDAPVTAADPTPDAVPAALPGESDEAMEDRLEAEQEALLDREWPRHEIGRAHV